MFFFNTFINSYHRLPPLGAISTTAVQKQTEMAWGRDGRIHPVATLPRLCTSLHFKGGLVATGGLTGVEGGEDGEEKRELE